MSPRRRGGMRQVFAVPAAIALASLVGLVSALLGDGVFNVVSWLALASIIGVAARKLWPAARANRPPRN